MSLIVHFFAISLGSAGLGYDVSLIGGLLTNDRWFSDLNVPQGDGLLGFVIASWMLGATIAAIPSAYLSDYIGRRHSIVLGCAVNILAIIIQSCAGQLRTFVVARILSGMATAILLTNSATYLNELMIQHRAVLTALAPTTFYLGSIPAAWCAYGALSLESSWSWRIVLLFQLPWPLLQILLIFFTPESPRWLIMYGKIDEARAIVGDVLFIEPEQGVWRTFFTRKYRYRLFLIILLGLSPQWVGNGIITYYLPPVLDTVGIRDGRQQNMLYGGLQIVNFAAAIIAALYADRLGRRFLLLASCTGLLLSMIALTACSAVYTTTESHAAAIIVVVAIFIFYISYDIGFTPIPGLYITELVPTELRAKAAALNGGLSGVAILINQWMNPVALSALGWKYYFVYLAVILLLLVCLAFAPETRGRTLEESTQVCQRPCTW